MMVSNGNITGLVETLVAQGLVLREAHASDRRATVVRLSAAGRDSFAAMAGEHGDWIGELFAVLEPGELGLMMKLLGRMKASVRQATAKE